MNTICTSLILRNNKVEQEGKVRGFTYDQSWVPCWCWCFRTAPLIHSLDMEIMPIDIILLLVIHSYIILLCTINTVILIFHLIMLDYNISIDEFDFSIRKKKMHFLVKICPIRILKCTIYNSSSGISLYTSILKVPPHPLE
jgi:hypothetical protein